MLSSDSDVNRYVIISEILVILPTYVVKHTGDMVERTERTAHKITSCMTYARGCLDIQQCHLMQASNFSTAIGLWKLLNFIMKLFLNALK
jgi:hypothetical protein